MLLYECALECTRTHVYRRWTDGDSFFCNVATRKNAWDTCSPRLPSLPYTECSHPYWFCCLPVYPSKATRGTYAEINRRITFMLFSIFFSLLEKKIESLGLTLPEVLWLQCERRVRFTDESRMLRTILLCIFWHATECEIAGKLYKLCANQRRYESRRDSYRRSSPFPSRWFYDNRYPRRRLTNGRGDASGEIMCFRNNFHDQRCGQGSCFFRCRIID